MEKKIEPPYSGKPDLILASIRKYNGYADKSIPEISISSLESHSLEKYLKLSEEKSQLEKRKKQCKAACTRTVLHRWNRGGENYGEKVPPPGITEKQDVAYQLLHYTGSPGSGRHRAGSLDPSYRGEIY